jgi:high-affinity Fe2+/Pb2+ permease
MNILRMIILVLAALCIGIGIYSYFNPAGDNVQFLLQISFFMLTLIVILLLVNWKMKKN